MNADNIDKYIELMYSEDSSLNKITDLQERKSLACKKCNMSEIDPVTRDIIALKNQNVNLKIFNYLNKNNSNEYIKLMADQQLFYNLQRILLEPVEESTDTNKLLQISERSEDLVTRIAESYKRIYKHEDMIKVAEKQIRMLSPEQRLREKKENKESA